MCHPVDLNEWDPFKLLQFLDWRLYYYLVEVGQLLAEVGACGQSGTGFSLSSFALGML